MNNLSSQARQANSAGALIRKFWRMGKDRPEVLVLIILALITFGFYINSLDIFASNSGSDAISPTPSVSPTIYQNETTKTVIPTQPEEDSEDSSVWSPSPTISEPKVDCVGPDGNHLSVTQEECESFNSSWATPTPTSTLTPTPSSTQTPTPTPTSTPTPTP